MNLISMGQVHVQDYIGFKAGLEYPHISVFQNPHRSLLHTLIKTAKYGWNVTDELFLKATCYRLSGRTAAFHLFLCRSATKNSREGYG